MGELATTSNFNVRDVSEADYSQWRVLWDQYNEFYGRVGPTALSEDIVQSTWGRFFQQSEPVHCLVADNGGQLIGLAHYIFHRNTILIENTCYLQDLFTTTEVRGSGVGRGLIEALYLRAPQSGASGVYWHTHSSNKTAMQLYDRMAQNTDFVVYRKAFDTDRS